MMRRVLGNSGVSVSMLGLGTVKFGRSRALRYPEFELPDERTLGELLACAEDLGINLLDTAPAYGLSEERLGRALRGRRQNWVLSTKCGEEFSAGRSSFDFSAAHTRRSVERSLRRLGTDYLDLVLLHSAGDDCALLETHEALDTLRALQREGCVRAVGISTKTPKGALAAVDQCDVVMLCWNPAYRDEEPAIERAAHSGCAVLVKKVLDSGRDIAGFEHGLEYLYAQAAVASVLVGTIDTTHLRANAQAAIRASNSPGSPAAPSLSS